MPKNDNKNFPPVNNNSEVHIRAEGEANASEEHDMFVDTGSHSKGVEGQSPHDSSVVHTPTKKRKLASSQRSSVTRADWNFNEWKNIQQGRISRKMES